MVLHSKKQLGRKKQEVDPNSGYGGKNAQKLKHVTKNYPNNKIMDAFDFFFVSTSLLSFKKNVFFIFSTSGSGSALWNDLGSGSVWSPMRIQAPNPY